MITCDWQTEYGTRRTTEPVLCGLPTKPGYPWCDEHIQDALDNYPRWKVPIVAFESDPYYITWAGEDSFQVRRQGEEVKVFTVVNRPQSDAEARSMASAWWHTGGGSAVQYAEHEGVK